MPPAASARAASARLYSYARQKRFSRSSLSLPAIHFMYSPRSFRSFSSAGRMSSSSSCGGREARGRGRDRAGDDEPGAGWAGGRGRGFWRGGGGSSGGRCTLLISSTLLCFFSSVLRALSFLDSYMRVPEACFEVRRGRVSRGCTRRGVAAVSRRPSGRKGARLLEHGEDLLRLHVEDLGDAALHDEEVRVVDVELHGVEEVLDAPVRGGVGRQGAVERALGKTGRGRGRSRQPGAHSGWATRPLMRYLLRPPMTICERNESQNEPAGRPREATPTVRMRTRTTHLAGDGDLIEALISHRAALLVAVVEND